MFTMTRKPTSLDAHPAAPARVSGPAAGVRSMMPPWFPIQPKLAISSPGDPQEREADDIAEQVVRAADPGPVGPAAVGIQRKCATCQEDERPSIQPKLAARANPGAAPERQGGDRQS